MGKVEATVRWNCRVQCMDAICKVQLDSIMLAKCGMRSSAKKVGQDVPINAASLASWSAVSQGGIPA